MGSSNLQGAARRQVLGAIGACIIFLILCIKFRDWSPSPPEATVAVQKTERIPHKIWQIFFGYSPLNELAGMAMTWPLKNEDYAYTLISADGAERFARKYYSDRPDVLQTFLDIGVPVLRSDLLRYMVLEMEGGYYSDLDTTLIKPIRDWVPSSLQDEVRAIVGIEYDQGDRKPWFDTKESLMFCQWTMASVPGHPIMSGAVSSVVEALKNSAKKNQTIVSQYRPSDDDVLEISGPRMFSKAVFNTIAKATGTNFNHLNITGITEPVLFGDILILPINGFGSGQEHSNSWLGEGEAPGGLVRHAFKGSWKHGWPGSWTHE